ncbi:MAG: hypothetical protein FD123_2269 [Bacteroidetes bacterium]|nr:MAG: hypothetical protein FD123_2269 [Bacteroidota bacterium]
MKRKGIDFVYAPNGDMMLPAGISKIAALGFRDDLFIIPRSSIAGAGRTVETTTYSVGGKPMLEAVEAWISDPSVSLDDFRESVKVALSEQPGTHFRVNELKEFRIRNSWFSRGLYFKKQGAGGFTGCSIRDKTLVAEFQSFYGQG